MTDPREHSLRFKPRSVCDSLDGDNSPAGACMSLQNLLFDPSTPGVLCCRPANLLLNDFSSFNINTITTGSNPVAMALTPDGTKLLVCNYGSATVSVINPATNTVTETVNVGNGPSAVVITPDGTKAYVCNKTDNTVTCITISGFGTTTISSGVFSEPIAIAITPDGTKAYVSNFSAKTLALITVASNVVSGVTIALTAQPYAIVINSLGTIAYVAETTFNATSVDVVTLAGPTIVNVVTSNTSAGFLGIITPTALALTPDGSSLYAVNSAGGTVSVLDTSSNVIINTILVENAPTCIAINSSGTIAYAGIHINGNNFVVEITLGTGAIKEIQTVSPAIQAIVLSSEALYVTGSGAVLVINFSNVVTAAYVLGNIVYGLIGNSTTSGQDVPFAYNILNNTFQTVTGVTATNVPASQVTSGAWIPPDMDMVGKRIIVTHPGFNYADGFAFGFFDISGFSDTTTLNTVSGSPTLTGNPNIAGLAPGYLITATGVPAGTYVTNYAQVVITTTGTTHSNTTVDGIPSTTGMAAGQTIAGIGIPAGTTIASVTSSVAIVISQAATASATVSISVAGATITMSANATGTYAQESATITGGTASSPLWAAGNTTGATQLAGVASCVRQFNNRAYFGQGNNVVFTDTLSLNISNVNGVQVLTVGDTTPITKIAGLPEYQSTGGILQALIVFKAAFIQQITGDSATLNLVQNDIKGVPGTSAPRSVATTPNGIFYMANDGIRQVNSIGQVSEPDDDIAIPFIYAQVPSRVAAAYNADTYRICTQNANAVGTPYQGYYYNMRRKGWTGPHTFQDDLLVPYSNDFISFNNTIPGTMWQSFTVQGHADEGNTFIENGQLLTWEYQTSPMTDQDNMYANCAVRSTLDMALPATGSTYQFQASDEARGALAIANIVAFNSEAIWGSFDWGDGTLWGATQFGLGPQIVPWTNPLIFNKLVMSASGNSSLSLKLGAWYVGYEKLNFMMR